MPNKRQKKNNFHNMPIPIFTSARTYIPEIISEENTILNTDTPRSEIEQKLDFYRKKVSVYNTEKSTQNWVKKFEEFQHKYNYVTPLESIEGPHLIEQQICEYVAKMTKKDGGEYKATTIKQAVDAINRYLSKNDLQEKELGEKEGLMALMAQQVKEILDDEFLNPKTSQGLLYRVFFQNATIFACQGREHYLLQVNQFQIQPDGSILFYRYRSKNNQWGIQEGDAYQIHLPPDSPDTFDPVSDFMKYISKHPSDTPNNFYLHLNSNWHDTDVWYFKTYCGINRVRNFIKTAAQIFQDVDVSEDTIMNIMSHKSVQGVHAYKSVNKHQQINTMKILINTIESLKNSNKINHISSIMSAEFNSSHINVNTNTVSIQDINMVQEEFQNQRFIFNNCHFTNVPFHFQ
ncbi:13243_t:CDS:2 [Racocetra persica]|uniref:13243_t:CDS:1 n=1 Tax=Racocetra persica TaxID=160502 RepID=A0ACA9LAI7_9GLOM|nr:13243_t:CDS:2 [Racocetra persica]